MSSVTRDSFVHRWSPAAAPAAATTLLLLHGTGGNEQDLMSLGAELASALPEQGGANLLSPRGKVLENGHPRFFRRFAEGVFDEEDVKFRARELALWVRACSAEYGFDLKTTYAVGYSNGANIAAAVLLLQPDLLAGGVLWRPLAPTRPESVPDLSGKHVLIAGGQRDYIIGPQLTRELAQLLMQAAAEVTQHWHPGGHELSGSDVAAAKAWLASVRKGTATPKA
jgi:predicted esterase